MAVFRTLVLGVAGALTLGACGIGKDINYISDSITGKKSNSDVAVTTNAPLVTPPDYALRPPTDSKSAGNRSTERNARTVLRTAPTGTTPAVGRPVAPGERSPAENELLRKAGMERTTSSTVRRTLDIENNRDKADEKKFVDKVVKYDPNRKGTDDAQGRDARQSKPVIKRDNEF